MLNSTSCGHSLAREAKNTACKTDTSLYPGLYPQIFNAHVGFITLNTDMEVSTF